MAPNAFGYQSRVGLLGRFVLALILGDALASYDVYRSKKTIKIYQNNCIYLLLVLYSILEYFFVE